MTDCLVSSAGLGGSPGVVAIASGGGGGTSSTSSSNNHSISGGGCAVGDQETQQPHLPPALEMFAAAAAASNGSTSASSSTGSVGAAQSGLVATVVAPSSVASSAMDLAAAITSTGNNNGGSSRSSVNLRQNSPPAPLSPPSSASDASSSGAGGQSDGGTGDGCYSHPAATVPTSTSSSSSSAASNTTGKAVVGSGRIREQHLMQLISADTLEPFGYGPSHGQQRLQDQDESHDDVEKLMAGRVGCIDDGSAIRVGGFGHSSNIIDVHDGNDVEQATEDDRDVLSALNASAEQKELMALVAFRKLQQEQQERQRVKRLQVPRKPLSVKPAQTVGSRLQQNAPHHALRYHSRREGNDEHQQKHECEDNEQNCAGSDSMTAATTLGDLLENLSNCPEASGVDFDEKLLMRLMRNLTTHVKQSNDAGAPTSARGNNNHATGIIEDRRREARQASPKLLHDHLGSRNSPAESDDMLGGLETATDELSGDENGVGAAVSKKINAMCAIGSTAASSSSYQGHTAATASGLIDENDDVEHDLISGLHDDADNEDEENNDDLLGGSLEDEDGDGDGSGGSSSGGDGVCGVCREPYTQPPRVLSCLHVFCEACLAMLRSKKRQSPASNFGQMGTKPPAGASAAAAGGGNCFVVVCPKCQVETECAHGVQTLPLDYVLINRLDMEAIRKRTAVCTSCKSEDNAIARCQDCSNFLCSNCRMAHSSMLCFENHKVVSFEAFDQERAQIHRAVCCLRHPREVAVLYDPVCGTTMCNDCLVAGHQGHGCKKAFQFDSRERTNLTGLLGEARQKFNTFDEANDTLTTSLSELQLTRDSVRSSIEETFITYKNLLEQAKAAALEDLEKVHSAQEMRVMDDIQQCQESRVHLEHALSFADKLVKYGDAGEFLALKSLVTSRVRKLMCSCPQSKDQGELRFVTDEAKFAQAIQSLFGRVVPTGGSQHQSGSNSLLQTVPPSTDNPIGGLDSSHTSVSSVGSGTTGSLLNTSFAPEISNTSAARLLPADIVDAVSASGSSIGPPGPHFTSLDHAGGGVLHPILPPGGPMSAGGPPTLPPLDPIVAPAEMNTLRTALAQFGLATLAGVEQADVLPNPDVLPLLVHDVAPGPRGLGVNTETVRILPPNGPPNAVVAGPTDEENHLMNNLSALAKMGPMGPAPYAGSPVPMNGHGGPLRGGSGPVAPLAIAAGPLPGGLDAGGPAPGQRSPTSSVASVALSSSTPLPPPSVSSTGNSSAARSSTGRGTRVTPMHIRIKFGQLGSGPTQFSSPHGFCLGPNEEIVVADTNNHRVQIFDKAGELKNEFGTQGKEEGQLWYPRKVAVMKSTGTYVICDRGNERSRMQLFTKNGEFLKKIAIRYIDIVAGLALTSDGRIIAVDSVSPTVFVIAETGDLLLWFDCSEHMREPSDIAVWGTEFYICDFKGHCVVVYNECGTFLRRIGDEGLTNFPNGIDISDHGDILVGDSHGNRFHIVVFNREGQAISEFECPYCKVSRCCGLKITSEGYVVTLAKNNHHVLILNTLYIT